MPNPSEGPERRGYTKRLKRIYQGGKTMINRHRPLAFFCGMVLVGISAFADAAGPQRAFVSTGGNDANPCSLAAPCRGFAAAVTAVAASGEVIVLDSGGYGPVVINKPVDITAPPGV